MDEFADLVNLTKFCASIDSEHSTIWGELSLKKGEKCYTTKGHLPLKTLSKSDFTEVINGFHSQFHHRYIVQLHWSLPNSLILARDAAQHTYRLFGKKVQLLPHREFTSKRHNQGNSALMSTPEILVLFIEHIGFLIAGNSIKEIESTIGEVAAQIKNQFKRKAPSAPPDNHNDTELFIKLLPELFENLNLKVAHNFSGLSALFSNSTKSFSQIALPFTEFQEKICREKPIYIENFETIGELIELLQYEINEYREDYPYDPNILVIKNMGVFGLSNNIVKAQNALSVFEGAMETVFYAKYFGGAKFLKMSY